MKKLLYLFVLVFLVNSAIYVREVMNKEHLRRMQMAENSYSTGCYISATNLCSTYLKADKVFACFDNALAFCPKKAKAFREWIESGSK